MHNNPTGEQTTRLQYKRVYILHLSQQSAIQCILLRLGTDPAYTPGKLT